ncbi:MAG TPA: divergent PAP2 family protein [Candidatus Polarisedimenticolaceae bacterium]|nr:divergent PAP2 family protein [Candidatus Polarisedimenticolaceae bacterium]
MFNRFVVVPLLVWVITQFTKFVVAAFGGKVDFKYLYASGGMPSVHAAVVTSLAVTAFLVEGPRSPIFGLSIIVAAIVMYDAFGVRRAAGEQAVAINALIDRMKHDDRLPAPAHLREILGHKPLEVFVGAVMGLVLGGLFNYDKLGAFNSLITWPIPLVYSYALAAVGAVLLLAGAIVRFWLVRPHREIALARQAAARTSMLIWSFGLLSILLAFLQYEKLKVVLWVLWPCLLLVLLLVGIFFIVQTYYKVLPPALDAHRTADQKKRWFEGPNKKRRAKATKAKKRK